MSLYSKKVNLTIFLAVFFLLTLQSQAEAYIGPGAGFAIAGSFMVMFTAILSALLALFTWPVRLVIRFIKGRHAMARSRVKKVIVLGLDGLDPKLAQKFMDEGKLPNMAKLKEDGSFKPLATTIPSISPVAWSSFLTGVNPGKHNIFDFLTRDKRTYQPKLSSVDIRGPEKFISLGKYKFPRKKSAIRLLRKGKPFWKTLGEHGVFSSILRVPITFPPEKFNGVLLSGMCVPDLRGSQGMFSFYTTANSDQYANTGGECFRVMRDGDVVISELVGPANPFVKEQPTLKCPFKITVKDKENAVLEVNGHEDLLSIGQYSDWIKVSFSAAFGIKVKGICKFLLAGIEPDLKLYVTPIQLDPERPAMPISHPMVYSTYLAKKQGSFATLGLAEDTWALNEKFLDDKGFIDQCEQIDNEREKMFFDSLEKVPRGLCVCVFDGTDRLQHTFWRQIDEEHPAHKEFKKRKNNVIEDLYIRMDALVGKTMEKCDNDKAMLMVISDHGFNSFRYGIDLNRWLLENGYLALIEGETGNKHLASVDWSKTRAYAIGLAGIFLNLKGREGQGIVNPDGEATALREEIENKLMALRDPFRNSQAIKTVYNALKTYTGPYRSEAPDLIIGYQAGYRAAWETAIGEITETVFHDNTKAWSGDHCIDHTLVPGVLFCNRRIETENPRLMDIGPTILDMFGVTVPKNMDGKPLAVADGKPK